MALTFVNQEGDAITLVNSISERMKSARKDAGLSQVRLADIVKVSPGAIGNIEAGIRQNPRELLAIADALGVNPNWLKTGKGPRSAGFSSQSPLQIQGSTENSEQPIGVPLLAVGGSMGAGEQQVHDEVVIGRLTLSPRWIDKTLAANPQNLRFIHGYGDSMEPTFIDGDILLVDGGIHDVKVDGIYVLAANDRLYIKRVRQRMDGSYEISSDNPTVKTVDVMNGDNPVEVLGKVVWLWNGRKL